MIAAWWDRFPGRLPAEEAALTADGIGVRRDDAAFRRGVVRLELTLPPGRWLTQRLVAVYPDLFPYLRPEVYAPELHLDRHQNPFKGNLCLLGRATDYWVPSTTLAELLSTQLPALSKALEANTPAEAAQIEDAQGEPITAFFDYESDSVVVVDSDWNIPPAINAGTLTIRLLNDSTTPFRGVVTEIRDDAGTSVARASLRDSESTLFRARWCRLPEGIHENNPDRLLAVAGVDAQLNRAPLQGDTQILGLVFPEELGHRRMGNGWLFVVRRRGNAPGFRKGHRVKTAFMRSVRMGIPDLGARVPMFAELQRATVAVFGIGCLGSPSVIELAKAGVGNFKILDGDIVEGATITRWSLGLPAVGRDKIRALGEHLHSQYPWVHSVYGVNHKLGTPDPKTSERKILDDMLTGVDLVYDALAETGLQYAIAELARERQIPYISVDATRGGYGGTVVRLVNDETSPCWGCVQQGFMNGELPHPPEDPNGSVQPEGCQEITYVGAHFDLQEIALQGVRLAVATIGRKYALENDDFGWNVGVLSLRDAAARRIEPRWSVSAVSRRADCRVCG